MGRNRVAGGAVVTRDGETVFEVYIAGSRDGFGQVVDMTAGRADMAASAEALVQEC